MVGIVFHQVITFDDPHAYVVAVKLTAASNSVESKTRSQRIERQFTNKQPIMNLTSTDTGTSGGLHSN